MGAELVLRVNVYGLRHITERLLATGQLADGASIVNIASLAGMAWERHLDRIAELDAALDFEAGIAVAKAYERGGPAAYVLSKEWVVAYTQRLSGQLLPQRIRVNSVSPGPVLTPLFPYFEADAGAEQMAWMNEQVGRAAEPDDEAAAIAWLLVGDGTWINGVDLPVDGGLSARMRVGWADTKASPPTGPPWRGPEGAVHADRRGRRATTGASEPTRRNPIATIVMLASSPLPVWASGSSGCAAPARAPGAPGGRGREDPAPSPSHRSSRSRRTLRAGAGRLGAATAQGG